MFKCILKYKAQRLKKQMLDLVEEYNADPLHRNLEVPGEFGKMDKYGEIPFWIYWHDDIDSTHMIGFNFCEKKLEIVSAEVQVIAFRKAKKNFLKQLTEIPR